MGRKKAGMCKCGHELRRFHDDAGVCTYGAGTLFAGSCEREYGGPCSKARRKKGEPMKPREVTVNGDAIVGALDAVMKALAVLRAELVRGKVSKGGHIMSGMLREPSAQSEAAPQARAHTHTNGTAAAVERHTALSNGGARSDVGKGERAILIAIAQRPTGATHAGIAVLTGYKETSRRTYLQRLTSSGLVEQRGDRFVATQAGLIEAGDFERLPTGTMLLDHWLERLPEGERVVFGAVVGSGTTTLEHLQTLTDYKETSVRTYVQRLSARELVTNDRGVVSLSKELLS